MALITIGPERNSPQALADDLSNLGPRIIGLSGEPDMIAMAASEFRLRYNKVPTGDGDQTMSHTARVLALSGNPIWTSSFRPMMCRNSSGTTILMVQFPRMLRRCFMLPEPPFCNTFCSSVCLSLIHI